ncbi:bromodomain and wd repeat-containing protein 1 [Lichtheimia corymbifera JMRC:FSU:9682]|uniref:Bromodomain and wd repeat-containing protein 1 n=1 Tax=Lichtheimia corymbifera JMRC:FSU:9682 TaxID=1263082 RepID=A0A068S813_9FUNG|nr:bromodomain and wd repeat-containing protein 1 [Lichtheimia corymbifera JMRC:FSU:9682]
MSTASIHHFSVLPINLVSFFLSFFLSLSPFSDSTPFASSIYSLELYYLIFQFLSSGPCQEAARALKQELQLQSLLPGESAYSGAQTSKSFERLQEEYPRVGGGYLLDIIRGLVDHFKQTGDPETNARIRKLRHGDECLLTLAQAFEPDVEENRSTTLVDYRSLSMDDRRDLVAYETLKARETNSLEWHSDIMQTFLATAYQERVTLSGHRQHAFCLAFDQTDKRIITGSDDTLVKVWDARNGHLIHTIRGHKNVITDIAINEENTLIATASSDGYVRVWAMSDFAPIATLKSGATRKPFTTVKFSPSPSPDTRYLMATSEDGSVRLWKWDKDTLQFLDVESPIAFYCKFKGTDRARCSSFNYTGTRFAVGGDDGFVYIFTTVKSDAAGQSQLPAAAAATTTTSSQTSMSTSQDPNDPQRGGRGRRRIASALFPVKNAIVEEQAVVPIAHLEGHRGSVTDLAYNHQGDRILSGSQDGTARIWKYNAVEEKWESFVLDIKKEHHNPIIVTDRIPPLSHNGNTAEETKNDEEGQTLPPLDNERPPKESNLSDTPDNTNNENQAAAAAAVPTMDGLEFQEPPKVSMITWTADDMQCIVATTHGDIRVYQAYTGKLYCILRGHTNEVYAVDSHPTIPGLVISAGYDGRIILWDLDKRLMIKCEYFQRIFLDCKFSHDGHQYAVTDEDGSCTLFSVDSNCSDYDQVNTWTRGQFFYSDYLPLVIQDGIVLDEQSLTPPHAFPYTPIVSMTGVAYSRQKLEGYGRDIEITNAEMETKYERLLSSYRIEEREIKKSKPIVPAILDRTHVARIRKEFVRTIEEEEPEPIIPEVAPPPPVLPMLLPDDPDDEDYDENLHAGGDTSEESDGAMSENNYAAEDENENEAEEEESSVRRTRYGRRTRRPSTTTSFVSGPVRSTSPVNTRRARHYGRTTRSRTATSGGGNEMRITRSSRRRIHEDSSLQSDEAPSDNDEQPIQPRRHRDLPRHDYRESADEESEEEESEVEEEEQEEEEDQAVNVEGSESDDEDIRAPRTSKRKRQIISTDESGSDDNFAESSSRAAKRQPVGKHKPERAQTTTRQAAGAGGGGRKKPRALRMDEIPAYEPREWLLTTSRNVLKYHPQVGDNVAVIVQGHRDYWHSSKLKDMFDENHGPIQSHDPVVFGTVKKITWRVGPPTFCQLKLELKELVNARDVLIHGHEPTWLDKRGEVMIDYSDEDGTPEFLVLWEQFLASMQVFNTLKVGERVDALYDVGKYTGTVSQVKRDISDTLRNAPSIPNPWQRYHIIWDDEESTPEDLSPWEIVPAGQDFNAMYNVGPELSVQDKRRAREILDWLMNNEEFQLYVEPVDYYSYRQYLSLIAYPICLQTVSERLEGNFYRSKQALIDDVDLIRKNATTFNDSQSIAYKNANRLATFFKNRFKNPTMAISLGRSTRSTKQETDDEDYKDEEEVPEDDDVLPRDEVEEESPNDLNNDSNFIVDDEDDDSSYKSD